MRKVMVNRLGKIDISTDVITAIAGQAAAECLGIKGLAAQRIRDGLGELLGRAQKGKGVEIQPSGDGRIIVTLFVIVDYGVRVAQISEKVMREVKNAIETTTGLLVEKVNVSIQGVKNKGEHRLC